MGQTGALLGFLPVTGKPPARLRSLGANGYAAEGTGCPEVSYAVPHFTQNLRSGLMVPLPHFGLGHFRFGAVSRCNAPHPEQKRCPALHMVPHFLQGWSMGSFGIGQSFLLVVGDGYSGLWSFTASLGRRNLVDTS